MSVWSFVKQLDDPLQDECESFCFRVLSKLNHLNEEDFAISEALMVLNSIIDCNLCIDEAFVNLMCIYGVFVNIKEDENEKEEKKECIEFITRYKHLTTDNDFIIEYILSLTEWMPNLKKKHIRFKYCNLYDTECESILCFHLNGLREISSLIIEYTQYQWLSFIEMINDCSIIDTTIVSSDSIAHFIKHHVQNEQIALEMDRIVLNSIMHASDTSTCNVIRKLELFKSKLDHNYSYAVNPKYFLDLMRSVCGRNTKYWLQALLGEWRVYRNSNDILSFPGSVFSVPKFNAHDKPQWNWDNIHNTLVYDESESLLELRESLLFIIDDVIMKYLFDPPIDSEHKKRLLSSVVRQCFLLVLRWQVVRREFAHVFVLFDVFEHRFLRNKQVFDTMVHHYIEIIEYDNVLPCIRKQLDAFFRRYEHLEPVNKIYHKVQNYFMDVDNALMEAHARDKYLLYLLSILLLLLAIQNSM
eukprot:1012865_1